MFVSIRRRLAPIRDTVHRPLLGGAGATFTRTHEGGTGSRKFDAKIIACSDFSVCQRPLADEQSDPG